MIIGAPRERKVAEYRVGMCLESASKLSSMGHKVLVGRNAGLDTNIADDGIKKQVLIFLRIPGASGKTANLLSK